MANLTAREREVLRLLAQGKRQADIAEALCISARTVQAHAANIRQKSGARSTFQAAVRAAVEMEKQGQG